MMRSMFAGVSGMRSHQQMMDVIGDNIANVNSSGFKASRVVFQDTLSQMVRDGSAGAAAANGGTNAAQVGLGVKLNAIDSVMTQGAIQSTGRPSDLAIQGAGYFAVRIADGSTSFTRSGSFSLDNTGRLVDPAGGVLLDTAGQEIAVPAGSRSFSVGSDGRVTSVAADGSVVPGPQVGLAVFENPAGLTKGGDGRLRWAPAAGTNPAGAFQAAGAGGAGTLAAGALEMSNVDLAQEFTNMMIAQRGFQANSKIISTSDELLQELVNLKR
ncbi:MAG: flgG [Frankiales bacterium]|nr:flgG [Frankiales bacterium]